MKSASALRSEAVGARVCLSAQSRLETQSIAVRSFGISLHPDCKPIMQTIQGPGALLDEAAFVVDEGRSQIVF